MIVLRGSKKLLRAKEKIKRKKGEKLTDNLGLALGQHLIGHLLPFERAFSMKISIFSYKYMYFPFGITMDLSIHLYLVVALVRMQERRHSKDSVLWIVGRAWPAAVSVAKLKICRLANRPK